jgi:hypothetical protein
VKLCKRIMRAAKRLKDPTRTPRAIFRQTLAPEVANQSQPAGSRKVKVAREYLAKMRLKKLFMNWLPIEAISAT